MVQRIIKKYKMTVNNNTFPIFDVEITAVVKRGILFY